MNPNVLKFLTKFGVPGKKHTAFERAILGREKTKSLGGFQMAEDHLDKLLEDAGIPMMVIDEMTGKYKRSAAAEELLELMRLLGRGG